MSIHRVILDPYVAFSILDHHQRTTQSVGADDEEKVSVAKGFLLGKVPKGVAHVRNLEPSLDMEFVEVVVKSGADKLMGYYMTGNVADPMAVMPTAAKPNTVFLRLQVPTAAAPEIRFRAFIYTHAGVFREAPCVIQSDSAASNSIVANMAHSLMPQLAAAADPSHLAPGSVPPEKAAFAELMQIRDNLKTAHKYATDAAAGKSKPDPKIAQALSDALVANSVVCPADASASIQNAVMMQYIASLLGKHVAGIRKAAGALNQTKQDKADAAARTVASAAAE